MARPAIVKVSLARRGPPGPEGPRGNLDPQDRAQVVEAIETAGKLTPFDDFAAFAAAAPDAPAARIKGGLEFVQDDAGPILANGRRWRPGGRVATAHFGHLGTPGVDESARVQAALDWVGSRGGGTVTMSAPLWIASPILIPDHTTLDNPERYVTTLLPGCRDGYRNKLTLANWTVSQSPRLVDPVIDGANLPDAWHGIYFEGAASPSVVRPKISNFTARATDVDGAGHQGGDGSRAYYAGYDDATGIFFTTYMANGTQPKRTNGWRVEEPVIDNCCIPMICTTAPTDSGSDGAGFGVLRVPKFTAFTTHGAAFRFGEGTTIEGGRVETPHPVPFLVQAGDTILTVQGTGTDGVMFTAYVRLVEMVAGQTITQLTINGSNALSAPVPFRTDLSATMDDLLAAVRSGPAAQAFDFARSARRPALFIYAKGGAKLPTGTTALTIATDAERVLLSGPGTNAANVSFRGSSVTGLKNRWGFPEGHEGSDTIGFLCTDNGQVTAENLSGNGPIDRVWFAADPSNLNTGGNDAFTRFDHRRSPDMSMLGGALRIGGDLEVGGTLKAAAGTAPTTAAGLTITPANLGDWSVTYDARSIQRIPIMGADFVTFFLSFTPTFTVGQATGALNINLPPELVPLTTPTGLQFVLDVVALKTNTVPSGTFLGGPQFRVLSAQRFGQVAWITAAGTSSIWSVNHLTSGQNAQLRVSGLIPVTRP